VKVRLEGDLDAHSRHPSLYLPVPDAATIRSRFGVLLGFHAGDELFEKKNCGDRKSPWIFYFFSRQRSSSASKPPASPSKKQSNGNHIPMSSIPVVEHIYLCPKSLTWRQAAINSNAG